MGKSGPQAGRGFGSGRTGKCGTNCHSRRLGDSASGRGGSSSSALSTLGPRCPKRSAPGSWPWSRGQADRWRGRGGGAKIFPAVQAAARQRDGPDSSQSATSSANRSKRGRPGIRTWVTPRALGRPGVTVPVRKLLHYIHVHASALLVLNPGVVVGDWGQQSGTRTESCQCSRGKQYALLPVMG